MRIAVCHDDERERACFLEMITEYQLSRGVNFDCLFFIMVRNFCAAERAENMTSFCWTY